MDSDGDDSSVASADLDINGIFIRDLRRIKNNDPRVNQLFGNGIYHDFVRNMTAEGWEIIGRDISNNTYLKEIRIIADALDDEKLPSLFRGLSRSSSIIKLDLSGNDISAAGLMSLEPFLQHSTKLLKLSVTYNDIQTEGFNFLMQILRDSPVESLYCSYCGITSIEIDTVPKNLKSLVLSNNDIQSEGFDRLIRSLCDSSIEDLYCDNCCIEIVTNSFPRSLKTLDLSNNEINSNGCRGIAKLLQKGGITLEKLDLHKNLIDDEGVEILVDSLKTNTSLKELHLVDNNGISRNGRLLLLKMLNDISSIKSTLQSNHTLRTIRLGEINDDIYDYISMATKCNRRYSGTAGREKVIQTQLHSQTRAELVRIQGVQHSLYSEIDPLHLPEVLSLVSRRHGQGELYVALKASIAEVISTVDRKKCLLQQRDYYVAKTKQINAELERIEAEESNIISGDTSNKRRRKWWWGIWG